jgi:hypothetical protein
MLILCNDKDNKTWVLKRSSWICYYVLYITKFFLSKVELISNFDENLMI